MFKAIDNYSLPGQKSLNEDTMVVNPALGILGVFDGVTSLTDYVTPEGQTGGYVASHVFRDHFAALQAHQGDDGNGRDVADEVESVDLAGEITLANSLVAKRMADAGIDLRRKDRLWSTTVAIVRVDGDVLEYAQLGDSMVVAIYEDDSYRVLTTDTVDGISERVRRVLGNDPVSRDAFLKLLPMELAADLDAVDERILNRYMANAPSGYSVANGREEVKDYIETGQLPLRGVRAVLLMTDGMFHPFVWEGVGTQRNGVDWDKTVHLLDTMGVRAYAEYLHDMEARFGLYHDDKTGVILRL